MKRVLSACLEQIQCFETEKDLDVYLKGLERKRIVFKILSRDLRPDGSVLVTLKKAYNNYSVGDYFA